MNAKQMLRPLRVQSARPQAGHAPAPTGLPIDLPNALGLRAGEVHVWQVALTASESQLRAHDAFLSADEQRRAERFRSPGDRARYVAARGTLRLLLARYVDAEPHRLAFAYGAHGKPRLSGAAGRTGLQFNVAHSGDVALIALAQGAPLGVDVEQVQDDLDVMETGRAAFSAREYAALQALPVEDRRPAFFTCWARKEAYAKALGQGVSVGMDTFDVTLRPHRAPRILWADGDPDAPTRWSLHAWPLHDSQQNRSYAAALCVEGKGMTLNHWTMRPERGGR